MQPPAALSQRVSSEPSRSIIRGSPAVCRGGYNNCQEPPSGGRPLALSGPLVGDGSCACSSPGFPLPATGDWRSLELRGLCGFIISSEGDNPTQLARTGTTRVPPPCPRRPPCVRRCLPRPHAWPSAHRPGSLFGLLNGRCCCTRAIRHLSSGREHPRDPRRGVRHVGGVCLPLVARLADPVEAAVPELVVCLLDLAV